MASPYSWRSMPTLAEGPRLCHPGVLHPRRRGDADHRRKRLPGATVVQGSSPGETWLNTERAWSGSPPPSARERCPHGASTSRPQLRVHRSPGRASATRRTLSRQGRVLSLPQGPAPVHLQPRRSGSMNIKVIARAQEPARPTPSHRDARRHRLGRCASGSRGRDHLHQQGRRRAGEPAAPAAARCGTRHRGRPGSRRLPGHGAQRLPASADRSAFEAGTSLSLSLRRRATHKSSSPRR